jgi:hypothetical protein
MLKLYFNYFNRLVNKVKKRPNPKIKFWGAFFTITTKLIPFP